MAYVVKIRMDDEKIGSGSLSALVVDALQNANIAADVTVTYEEEVNFYSRKSEILQQIHVCILNDGEGLELRVPAIARATRSWCVENYDFVPSLKDLVPLIKQAKKGWEL